jgi:hypothetical protein
MFGTSLILIGALLGSGLAAGFPATLPVRIPVRRRKPRCLPGNGGRDHA